MYYIQSQPNSTGNHGNPMGQPFPGCVNLPDELLAPYIEARGFVNLTLEGNTVTSVETNQEALDTYLKANPEPDALSQAKEEKIAEMSAACNAAIVAGLDIQLTGDKTEHFDYSERDQINIKEMFDAVLMGASMYPYQSEDGQCRTYTPTEIVTIYSSLAGNKTAQLTYYHQIKDYIGTLETSEEVKAVIYGQPLTGEYLEHYNAMISVAAEQMQTVIAKVASAMNE